MSGSLTLLDGSTFFVTEANGDVDATRVDGLFHEDMRHLSLWQVRVDGRRLHPITTAAVDYYSGRIHAIPEGDAGGEHFPLSVRRDRFVTGGVHEVIELTNHGPRPASPTVEIRFGADFADVQAVQRGSAGGRRVRGRVRDGTAVLERAHRGHRRRTELHFSGAPRLTPARARFELELAPGESWRTCVDLVVVVDGDARAPTLRGGGFHQPDQRMPMAYAEWMDAAPAVVTDWDALAHAVTAGLADLAALRLRPTEDASWSVPAGGLPWFMALFGRDTIFAAYQALPFHSELAQTTLTALARFQATEDDAFRDAEPGKILHELRRGELSRLGELPHDPYYGSHDSTALFLILLDEYHRWTGDDALVRELEPAARAALDWIERHGDRDGDGYLEYVRRSPKGLRNQCWKDSDDAIRFADGRLADGPIATCELQGYAYDARLRLARLARRVLADVALARRLERDAARLKRRFNADFWDPARRHFVLALDGEKRRVDAMTSNVGHLLWSGIVDGRRAQLTGARLLASDVFTGWGLRTMSALDAGYSPLEYHRGTVWPFDTALAAEGLRRYGLRDGAGRLAVALVEASEAFGHRLPEVFAGFQRDVAGVPAEYPNANRPQAFSAGAPLLAVRTLLGLDAGEDGLECRPHLPAGALRRLELRGVWARGRRHDVPAAPR
jgi:glycogen debranching enzyme